jgi:hypothetical protein
MVTNLMKEANNRVGLTHYKTRLTKVNGIDCTKTKQEISKNIWDNRMYGWVRKANQVGS